MVTDSKLVTQKREKLGSSASRRLRQQGLVPGNVYGHGETAEFVSIPADRLTKIVMTGHKVVDLDLSGTSQTAIIREVQWDTFGHEIYHVDLVRVSADETVEVEVAIELHGNAPGIAAGGVLEQHLRSLSITCLALQIPDTIVVGINHLEKDQALHVRDLKLAEGIVVQNDPDEIIVQIVEPTEQLEDASAEPGPAEPEVIGRKEEEPEDE